MRRVAAALLVAAMASWAAPRNLEQMAVEISKELRSPSSVNTSLYESETREASELKARIYMMLREGRSREEILKYMTEHYGETVRYSPELTAGTAALWVAPWIALALVAGIVVITVRRRRRRPNKEN